MTVTRRQLRRAGRIAVRVSLILSALTPITRIAAPAHAAEADAEPGIGVQLMAEPSRDPATPESRIYIVGSYAPGTTVRRRVLVTNATTAPATVAVYAGAASIRAGVFTFAKDRSQNTLSRWTRVGAPVLQLAPGASAVEPVTVHVARGAVTGKRYAVVWAAVTSLDAGAGVRMVNRVGIRMYLSIGPGGRQATIFTLSRPRPVSSSSRARLVAFTVRNIGRGPISFVGQLTLSRGPFGLRAGPFPIRSGSPLPSGHSRRIVVRLNALLPAGPWRVGVTFRSDPAQHATSARLTFPAHES